MEKEERDLLWKEIIETMTNNDISAEDLYFQYQKEFKDFDPGEWIAIRCLMSCIEFLKRENYTISKNE